VTSATLVVENLRLATPAGRRLLGGLSFTLNPGEILVLTGANGLGKSTLLKAVLGAVQPAVGRIELGVPRKRLGYLPQLHNTALHLPMTLFDVVRIHQSVGVGESAVTGVGLLQPPHLRLGWNTASGGERQRALLTSLLLQEPELLLLDEPLNHLDAEGRAEVMGLLERYVQQPRSYGRVAAILMVSHGHDGLHSGCRHLALEGASE